MSCKSPRFILVGLRLRGSPTQPRARAYTTYYCANNPAAAVNPILSAICDTWLELVQEYATNATLRARRHEEEEEEE